MEKPRHHYGTGWVLSVILVWLVLLAGCAPTTLAPSPSPTTTPSPTIIPLPSFTPIATRPPRPPATRTTTPVPPKLRAVQLNQTVDAVFSPGDTPEYYVFTSDRARWVGIELSARDGKGDLRLVVQVYDTTDSLIPRVSAPVGQPTLRDVWDIPTAGAYTIRIFGTETEARAFDLRVFSVPIPEIGGGSIACNETRSGEIAVRGQRDQWVFEGQADARITVSMLAPGNDGIIELYDPDDDLIAHGDNVPQPNIGTTLDMTLPADGIYTIVTRMFADAQAGTYRLTLVCE